MKSDGASDGVQGWGMSRWSDSEEWGKFGDGTGGRGLSGEFNLSYCHMTSELSALPIQLLIALVSRH